MEATRAGLDVVEALVAGEITAVPWFNGDDLCDCSFQRLGMWKNPYLAETHEIRLCCIWAELGKMFPSFVRTLPGFRDDNTGEWITEPRIWDGEDDMPAALWHRQLARASGMSLPEARVLGQTIPAPAGRVPEARPFFFLKMGGDYLPVELLPQ